MIELIGAAVVVLAYLLGSIPTGVIIARAHRVDLRAVGSGNIGATNVARALGKRLGVLTLVGDTAKGALPVLFALTIFRDPLPIAGTGLAAVLGHVFPVYTRFRGGKGVATSFGVILATAPEVAGVAFGIYASVYLAFRISSAGSLCATASVPALLSGIAAPWPLLVLGVALFVLIGFTHRANLRRLMAGEERPV